MTPEMAVAVAGLALIVALALAVQVSRINSRLNRRVTGVPPDGNLYDALRRLDGDLSAAEEAIAALRPVVQSLHERMPAALRFTAVVTYDATGDMAGNLSRSIALLNERADGIVITLLTRRTETLFFTKMVRGGRGAQPLSPEEEMAVARALGR